MSNMKNRITLIGRLGQAPELKVFENGNQMAKYALATNEVYKSSDGNKHEDTQWHQIIAWGKLAELSERYLRKGDLCALEGKVIYRSFENDTNEKMYFTEVVVHDLQFLTPKSSKESTVN
jgi:single-strand DNA-binding protein